MVKQVDEFNVYFDGPAKFVGRSRHGTYRPKEGRYDEIVVVMVRGKNTLISDDELVHLAFDSSNRLSGWRCEMLHTGL